MLKRRCNTAFFLIMGVLGEMEHPMDRPISVLTGVGDVRRRLLEEAGYHTLGDLVMHFPKTYVDTRSLQLGNAVSGKMTAAYVIVTGKPVTRTPRPGLTLTIMPVTDGIDRAEAVWYNAPWVARTYSPGWQGILVGTASREKGILQMLQPSREEGELPPLLPVYDCPRGMGKKWIRRLIWQALELVSGSLQDPLPEKLLVHYGLPEKNRALEAVHLPTDTQTAEAAGRRLALEELLLFVTAMDIIREIPQEPAPVIPVDRPLMHRLQSRLGYSLTAAQTRVLEEILRDTAQKRPMNRMVQGDVGCGKTVLALLAIANVLSSGKQAALMAPTEILARQLYTSAETLLSPFGYRVCLLLGSTPDKERRLVLEGLASGEMDLAVGTHALLSEGVTFRELALTVTDEQHRFGVRQRAAILYKGRQPHSLIMSATPVPRSLALVLYGDLALSVVNELPPGRKPIHTRIVPPERLEDMWCYIAREAAEGRQAYVICPAITESDALPLQSAENLYKELSEGPLAGISTGLVHGRMPEEKRDEVLDAFRRGELGVLVSTTVVEVGVHIPGACMMIIMNPERFGLAQLHQLRGRVGRGSVQSYCFLVAGEMGQSAKERLEVLTASQDGFYIAEEDLRQRGPGEFLGVRQSGMLDGRITALMADRRLLDLLEDVQSRKEEDPGAFSLLRAAALKKYASLLDGLALN